MLFQIKRIRRKNNRILKSNIIHPPVKPFLTLQVIRIKKKRRTISKTIGSY